MSVRCENFWKVAGIDMFFGPQMTPTLPAENASPGRKSQQRHTT